MEFVQKKWSFYGQPDGKSALTVSYVIFDTFYTFYTFYVKWGSTLTVSLTVKKLFLALPEMISKTNEART